jgi:hypothetical protein
MLASGMRGANGPCDLRFRRRSHILENVSFFSLLVHFKDFRTKLCTTATTNATVLIHKDLTSHLILLLFGHFDYQASFVSKLSYRPSRATKRSLRAFSRRQRAVTSRITAAEPMISVAEFRNRTMLNSTETSTLSRRMAGTANNS